MIKINEYYFFLIYSFLGTTATAPLDMWVTITIIWMHYTFVGTFKIKKTIFCYYTIQYTIHTYTHCSMQSEATELITCTHHKQTTAQPKKENVRPRRGKHLIYSLLSDKEVIFKYIFIYYLYNKTLLRAVLCGTVMNFDSIAATQRCGFWN